MVALKKLIFLIFISASVTCLAQSPYKKVADQNKKETFQFDALNKSKVIQHFETEKRKRKIDSVYYTFLNEFILASAKEKDIEPSQISYHPDSLIIKPEGIDYILKPKKK